MEVEMDHDDDVFHDIVGVPTDEEYFSKVGFDQRIYFQYLICSRKMERIVRK
jgi:hypothetical protein